MSHNGVNELHAVWDDIFWQHYGHQDMPLNEADWEAQGKNVTKLMEKWHISHSEATELDCMTWAKESFEITKTFVYKVIEQHVHLPDSYVA